MEEKSFLRLPTYTLTSIQSKCFVLFLSAHTASLLEREREKREIRSSMGSKQAFVTGKLSTAHISQTDTHT